MKTAPLNRLAHQAVADTLHRLDSPLLVVDATAGNGHDTVFLARCVGAAGYVLACDIQEQALCRCGERLAQAGLAARVRLIHGGHEHLGRYLDETFPARLSLSGQHVAAAMFNLGWLPGGNKQLITCPETTLAALSALLPRIIPGGILALHLYLGHPGGAAEAEAVQQRVAELSPRQWLVIESRLVQRKRGEILLLVYRHEGEKSCEQA